MNFIWIKDEFPQQWKQSSIVPIFIYIWGGWYTTVVINQLSNGKLQTGMLDKVITYRGTLAWTWR